MKNFYCAVTEEQNGKYFSTVEKVSKYDNILSILQRRKYITINICESKKEAEMWAKSWNNGYKANGTYLFD